MPDLLAVAAGWILLRACVTLIALVSFGVALTVVALLYKNKNLMRNSAMTAAAMYVAGSAFSAGYHIVHQIIDHVDNIPIHPLDYLSILITIIFLIAGISSVKILGSYRGSREMLEKF